MIPQLDVSTGYLPLGRYLCTIPDVETRFVKDAAFGSSTTRQKIFEDFLLAGDLIEAISDPLVERVWVGGSFVSGKLDPDDIDCTFVINGPAFRALSNGKQDKVRKFNQHGWARRAFNIQVEPFILVREPIANPWRKGGLREDALDYMSIRGAWDDWWQRVRTDPDKTSDPTVEDAEPKRGYLEVSWK